MVNSRRYRFSSNFNSDAWRDDFEDFGECISIDEPSIARLGAAGNSSSQGGLNCAANDVLITKAQNQNG
jgi:hypothetical protein